MNELHYFRPEWIETTDRRLDVDLCIYGATSAGVIAALEATERGKTVALLQPGKFIGGLTTGGLGWTDHGKAHVIGGKAREFYRRLGKHYGKAEEWYFEPHVAQAVFDDWLGAAGITPLRCQYLQDVRLAGSRIESLTCMGGLQVTAKVFLDCTYEGDLLAKAGVRYFVGREGNSTYGETLNGIQVLNFHQFAPAEVDPYVIPGDPASGLLPQIEPVDQTQHIGEADKRLQAYNFRICMTNDPALRIAWEKPERFDPLQYELAARWFAGTKNDSNDQLAPHDPPLVPRKFDRFPNKTAGGFFKTDSNNHGPVSSDFIGGNWEWPDACYERREALFQAHVTYQKGFYWFMANSDRVPQRYREAYRSWGLCRDEFTTTGGWSHTLYVREARRMVSDYVATEHDCLHKVKCEDPVGMGSYALDSHNCTRFVNAQGKVMNDGDVQRQPPGPYGISYRSIVPSRTSVQNLIVPVCCSTSHIAYGSVRMEPVFMILGQSAAIAGCMAIDGKLPVQDVSYAKLRRELERAGQALPEST
ncbi:MAG: FAD-dependent oxidoreductase [Tepidisphaeraceae bacterium]